MIPEPLIEASAWTRELVLVIRCAAWSAMTYLENFYGRIPDSPERLIWMDTVSNVRVKH